jgi:transposase
MAATNRCPIPNDHYVAGHFAHEMLEKGDQIAEFMAQPWLRKYNLPSGEMAAIADSWSRVHHSCRMGVWPTEVAILFRTHGDKGHCASEEVCSMSPPPTRKYPSAFKERAVKLAVEAGPSRLQTARALGVHEHTCHTWMGKDHRAAGQEPQVHDEHRYEELKRLRTENARFKEERDLRKKAAASFAQPLP